MSLKNNIRSDEKFRLFNWFMVLDSSLIRSDQLRHKVTCISYCLYRSITRFSRRKIFSRNYYLCINIRSWNTITWKRFLDVDMNVIAINLWRMSFFQQMIMSTSSSSFAWFIDPPIKPIVRAYVFNYTNIEDFINNGSKIHLEQVGPLVYT